MSEAFPPGAAALQNVPTLSASGHSILEDTTKPPLVSVYELVNSTKKEFLVWIGNDGHMLSQEYVEALRPAHWSAAEKIEAHTVESGLDLRDALEFRDNYAKNMGQMPGWSVQVIVIDPES